MLLVFSKNEYACNLVASAALAQCIWTRGKLAKGRAPGLQTGSFLVSLSPSLGGRMPREKFAAYDTCARTSQLGGEPHAASHIEVQIGKEVVGTIVIEENLHAGKRVE
jgi:hypothetical protein